MTDPEQALTQMETALSSLRQNLSQGRFDGLPDCAATIESLLPRLAELTDDISLQRLRDLAADNETCLSAAQRGVRAARNRLAEVTAAAQGFATYDGTGRRALVESGQQKLTQRF